MASARPEQINDYLNVLIVDDVRQAARAPRTPARISSNITDNKASWKGLASIDEWRLEKWPRDDSGEITLASLATLPKVLVGLDIQAWGEEGKFMGYRGMEVAIGYIEPKKPTAKIVVYEVVESPQDIRFSAVRVHSSTRTGAPWTRELNHPEPWLGLHLINPRPTPETPITTSQIDFRLAPIHSGHMPEDLRFLRNLRRGFLQAAGILPKPPRR
jgi:hypothetical protein